MFVSALHCKLKGFWNYAKLTYNFKYNGSGR